MTESTEQPNIEALLQILNLLEQRLGARMNNEDSPFAIMISLNDNQQLVIAFSGANLERPNE